MQLELIAQEKSTTTSQDNQKTRGESFKGKTACEGALIEKVTVVCCGEGSAPAEKTQFDVILKSKILTDKNGEFNITIPPEQFKLIPENSTFDLKLKIKPPKDFPGVYESDEAKVTLKKKDGPRYKLILHWVPIKAKSNKVTFAVSAKAQT